MSPGPYTTYLPSGIPWLGDVPAHWDVRRAGWLFRTMDRPVRDSDEVVTCFRDGTVTLRKNRRTEGFTESLQEIGYQGIRRGDLVIHQMDAFAGAVGVSDSDGKGTPAYSVCFPTHNADSFYYAHVVREMARNQWILALAKGIRERSTDFRYSEFARQEFPLPPFPEQQAIVRYLDHADRRIRRYISAKRKLIVLLAEEKQAVINRAVTRGLDPNVRLKPSGVEWLGDVPEHWEVHKLRQCVSISGGMTPNMEVQRFWNGQVPWVTPKDMKQAVIGDSSVKTTDAAISETSLRLVKPPVVLMVVRGMILARRVPIAYTTVPVTINQDMKALRAVNGANARFLACSLASAQEAFVPLIDEAGHGTRRLPMERWRELPMAMPPPSEQAAIVEHLNKATAHIDSAIAHARRQIELLQEYRTRLIADVVTGKLDVREAAADLPDENDEAEPIAESVQQIHGLEEDPYDADNLEEESAIESEVSI